METKTKTILKRVLGGFVAFVWVLCVAGIFSGDDVARANSIILFLLITISVLWYYFYPSLKSYRNKNVLLDVSKEKDFSSLFSETYSFIDFVKTKGTTINIVTYINKEIQAPFKVLELKDASGKITSVKFMAALGDVNAEMLKRKKTVLFVGKYKYNNDWYLFEENISLWENVEL